MRRQRLALAFAILMTPACQTYGNPQGTAGCPTFSEGVVLGRLASNQIREASGIAASHRNSGVYYVNNDSGDRARIFAIDETGRDLGTYSLIGAKAVDWEDIAVGPASGLRGTFIYAADIGDNRRERSSVVVYRVPEPTVTLGDSGGRVNLHEVVALPMQYPDDAAHNAETLLIDPLSADLYIVTKAKNGLSKVFRYPAPQHPGQIAVLEQVASLQVGAPLDLGSQLVTGGDISRLRNQILLRTYTQVLLWQIKPGQSIAEAISGPACAAPERSEPQGEAIAWRRDESGYITVSENAHQPIHFFARTPD
jgi:hypothetical protein